MAKVYPFRAANLNRLSTRFLSLLRTPPLIAATVYASALLYSFPWFRIPEVAGVALPFQRVLGWLGLGLVVLAICLRGRFRANAAVHLYLAVVLLFFAVLGVTTATNVANAEVFAWLRYVSELSKYAAVFGVAFVVYYALAEGLVKLKWLELALIVSAAASVVIAYILLVLYWSGFRSTNEVLAHSFGGSLGVWPTGSFLPRLAGTTAEPQQFSVSFLTGLMLMLSRRYVRWCWPFALLGLLALVLSQSKFALISLVAVAFYVDSIYKAAPACFRSAFGFNDSARRSLYQYAAGFSQYLKQGPRVTSFYRPPRQPEHYAHDYQRRTARRYWCRAVRHLPRVTDIQQSL